MNESASLTAPESPSSHTTRSVIVSRTCWRDLLASHQRHASEPQWFHGLLYGSKESRGLRVALVVLQDELIDVQWKKLDDVHEHCLSYVGEAYTIRDPLPTVMTTPALRALLPRLAPDTPVLLLLGTEKPDVVCYSAKLFGVLRNHPVRIPSNAKTLEAGCVTEVR